MEVSCHSNLQIVDNAFVPLLEGRNLTKVFYNRQPFRRPRAFVTALDRVTLHLDEGKTTVLTGESGSGKSTLARCLVGLETPDQGQILWEGVACSEFTNIDRLRFRRSVQLVLQSASASMNPTMTVQEVLEEPLAIEGTVRRDQRRELVFKMMQAVGCSPDLWRARCSEVSGGQRQRLVIGRALMLNPRLLILDEALAGLDMPSKNGILELLFTLQLKRGVSYLFITHDRSLAKRVGPVTWEMREGRIFPQDGGPLRIHGGPVAAFT